MNHDFAAAPRTHPEDLDDDDYTCRINGRKQSMEWHQYTKHEGGKQVHRYRQRGETSSSSSSIFMCVRVCVCAYVRVCRDTSGKGG